MNITHEPGEEIEIEIEVRKAPDGRDGILFQEPNSWLFFMQPENARDVAKALLEAADELENLRSGKATPPRPPKNVTITRDNANED